MVVSGPEDRSLIFHSGIADRFDAEWLSQERLAEMRANGLRHVHVSGFYSCEALRKDLPDLLRRARACGLTTSLDPNHDATGEWATVDGLWDQVLPLLDVLLPNELEALALADTAPVSKEDPEAPQQLPLVNNNGGGDRGDSEHQLEQRADVAAGSERLEAAIRLLAKQTAGGCVVVTTGSAGRDILVWRVP